MIRVEKAPQGAAKAAKAHARGAWAHLDPLGVRNIPLRQQIQCVKILHFSHGRRGVVASYSMHRLHPKNNSTSSSSTLASNA
ncbi:hypothetical protein Taro_007334 [Colocasia esculenta]|uniref:Uncharacterized protein n=1 Tax=Colocasia esculenta TaxID=4460 RepID=A0A843TXV6_COLES|nr:hypothetical protein [Colocasia esculenta]